MLEKMLVLLERFVVAHELIAANSAKPAAVVGEAVNVRDGDGGDSQHRAPAKRTRATKQKAAPEPEPEQEEEAPKPKAKAKAKEAPDLDTLRQEIKDAAIKIAEEGSEDCCEDFDDLLADYKVRQVSRLKDDDIEDFHADLKDLVVKYFELED